MTTMVLTIIGILCFVGVVYCIKNELTDLSGVGKAIANMILGLGELVCLLFILVYELIA